MSTKSQSIAWYVCMINSNEFCAVKLKWFVSVSIESKSQDVLCMHTCQTITYKFLSV